MDLGTWRDISIVLLVIEGFILALIPLAIVYFLGRGVTYLLREIPKGFVQIRDVQRQVQDVATQVTDKAITPVLTVEQFVARVKGIGVGIGRQIRTR